MLSFQKIMTIINKIYKIKHFRFRLFTKQNSLARNWLKSDGKEYSVRINLWYLDVSESYKKAECEVVDCTKSRITHWERGF